jgi:glycine/D-amino acid oxidase-like deaminating enzyme
MSRLGGGIYVAGLNSASIPLPDLPTDAQVSPASIDQLISTARAIIGPVKGAAEPEVLMERLCFRPVSSLGTGLPILSRIPDALLGGTIKTGAGPEGGVFLAAGHGPWGISHSLGTGKVMAEMMQGRATSADINELSIK